MSILTTPADLAKGADPSPWTVNGDDLYPDSTSYLVGIGTTNPDTLLHIKATDGTPKIKLEGTDYDYTIEVDANHGATQASSLLRFESDTHWATTQIEFKNGSTLTSSNVDMYLTAKTGSSLQFYDGDLTANGKPKTVLTTNYTTDRFYLYGEDGFAAGMLTMDFSQANDARFAFGYGDEALSTAARLAIKHTSNPQLALTDGTDTATFKTSDTDLTVEHNDSSWNFTLNATTNTNLVFAKGGTVKASLRHHGATEGLLGVQTGMFKNNITPASAASLAISAPNSFGNVIACDTTSNAITATLPAVADYQGVILYVIDSKGNSATTSRAITIAVQTGEKLDGVTNGTATINTNHGFSVLACTADGWFQVG